MNFMDVFINPIVIDQLNIDNDKIADYVLDLKEKDKGRKISNSGGWQSNNIDFKDEICFQELFTEIYKRMETILKEFEFDDELNINLENFWINVNNKGDYNIPHVHPNSLFSGIYYVNAEKDMGKIVFMNPIMAHPYCINSRMIKNYNTFNSAEWSIMPNTGLLVIFPSWLLHYVETNRTEENRISIAFNCFLT